MRGKTTADADDTRLGREQADGRRRRGSRSRLRRLLFLYLSRPTHALILSEQQRKPFQQHAGTQHKCLPTTSVRLRADGLLDSFHGAARKGTGGDEYYVRVVEDGREVAVADALDNQDGSYSLSFVQVEMPAPRGPTSAAALRVLLQFSCGVGGHDPPFKARWNASGWTLHEMPIKLAPSAPPAVTLVSPASPLPVARIDLRKYEALAAIGDSTVRHFRPLLISTLPLKFTYTDASGAIYYRAGGQRKPTCEVAADSALAAQGGVNHGARQLVLFGVGAWDLFDETTATALTTAAQYKAAFVQCLQQIKRRFPGGTLVLKSLFTMHPQRVDCEKAMCQSRMWGMASCGARCYARTKYMSASRAHRLFDLQEEAAAAEGVPTLAALHGLTSRHAHQTVQGDGLHFTPPFNDFLWAYHFGPRPRTSSRCIRSMRARPSTSSPPRCQPSLVEQHSLARCTAGVSFGYASQLACSGLRQNAKHRALWVRNCRGMFRCGNGPIVECGFPPGRSAYNCSCAGSDSQLYRWPCPNETRPRSRTLLLPDKV